MPISPEVYAFQSEVGGDQRIVSGPAARRQTHHGAVVSNSSQNRSSFIPGNSAPTPQFAPGTHHAADLSDQRFFGKRHSVTTISYPERGQAFT
jgi:hypothetical protein